MISLQQRLEIFKKILCANLRKSITICPLSERTWQCPKEETLGTEVTTFSSIIPRRLFLSLIILISMLGLNLHTRLIIMKAGPCSITYQSSNYTSVVGEERRRERSIKIREGKASKIPRIKEKKKD